MNPETSTLQSHVWFVMRWLDTRLKWVPTNYENISTVHLAPSKVWHPDIMVYNSVQHFDYEMTDLLVTSDGTVSHRQGLTRNEEGRFLVSPHRIC